MSDPQLSSQTVTSQSLKRMAEEDQISELIQKAKVSRYTSPKPRDDDQDDFMEFLEATLTCPICADLFVDPVTTIPCMHNFCGSCAVRWFSDNTTCPSCRARVANVNPNPTIRGLIETTLEKHPDKKRSEEELKELRNIYKPNQKINVYTDEDEDEDQDEENDDEIEIEQRDSWSPCPSCVEGNDTGYTCPLPIERPTTLWATETYRGHILCTHCSRTIPIGWKPVKCSTCLEQHCGNIHTSCPRMPQLDGDIKIFGEHTFSEDEIQLSRCFQANIYEEEFFKEYFDRDNLGWADLIGLVKDFTQVSPDTHICKRCAKNHILQAFRDWWIQYKESNNVPDSRVKCWYGKDCRTQSRPSHASRLNHTCNQTPRNERRNNAPPVVQPSLPQGTVSNIPHDNPTAASAAIPGASSDANDTTERNGDSTPN